MMTPIKDGMEHNSTSNRTPHVRLDNYSYDDLLQPTGSSTGAKDVARGKRCRKVIDHFFFLKYRHNETCTCADRRGDLTCISSDALDGLHLHAASSWYEI